MKYATKNNVTVDPELLKLVIKEVPKEDSRKASDQARYKFPETVKTPRSREHSLILLFSWWEY